MLGLAATYADIWNAEGPLQGPEEMSSRRAAGDVACVAVGRDPATLGRSASVVVNLPTTQIQSRQHSPVQGKQQGSTSPEEVAETLRGYAREGLSHVQLWLVPNIITSLEWFKAVLDLLDRSEA